METSQLHDAATDLIGRDGYGQALSLLSAALAQNPDPSVYNDRGLVHLASGFYKPALDDFNKASELRPDFARAYFNRGMAYRRMNRPEDAVADFSKAIELQNNCAEAYCNRGLAFLSLNQNDKAENDFNTALSFEKTPKLHFYLGIVYSRKSETV